MSQNRRPGRPPRDKSRDPYRDIRLRLTENAYNKILQLASNRQMFGKIASDLILGNSPRTLLEDKFVYNEYMTLKIDTSYLEYTLNHFDSNYTLIDDSIYDILLNGVSIKIGLIDPDSGLLDVDISSLCYISTELDFKVNEDFVNRFADEYGNHVLIPHYDDNTSVFRVFSICSSHPSKIIKHEIDSFVDFVVKFSQHYANLKI